MKKTKRKIMRTIVRGIRKIVNIGLALAALYGIFAGFGYIDANNYVKGIITCGLGLLYIGVFLHMNPQLQKMDD